MKVFSKLVTALVAVIGRKKVAHLLGTCAKTIERKETGKSKLSAKELVTLLYELKKHDKRIFDYIDDRYQPQLDKSGLGFINVKKFQSNDELNDYFTNIENDGRMIALSRFPSDIYLNVKSEDNNCKRIKRIQDGTLPNLEFYPISALIKFGFSPCSKITHIDKIEILERIENCFDGAKTNQLFFYDDDKLMITSHSEIEVLHTKKLLIMEIPSSEKSYIFFENPKIARQLYSYFNEELSSCISGLESRKIIQILKKTLGKGDGTNELIDFYFSCEEETSSGANIYRQLSPSIRNIIRQKEKKNVNEENLETA